MNTSNYNLVKPNDENYYNIEDFNNNSEIIDTELFKKIDKIEASQNNIIVAGSAGSLADSGVAIDNISKKISNPTANNILVSDEHGEMTDSGIPITQATAGNVASEAGVRGIRYINNELQVYMNDNWTTIYKKVE